MKSIICNKQKFNSQALEVGNFAENVSNNEIKNEPMFFNCDLQFAYQNGGPITKSFIDNLPKIWHESKVVFDSRIHMLMPGWYPSIPGYHHDDVARPQIPVGQHFITAGQPNYNDKKYQSKHILGLVNADVCPTHFAIGNCEMPEVYKGETIYKKWHPIVTNLVETNNLRLVIAKDRTLYKFDWETFHTGIKAVKNGWRWFGRISMDTDRVKTITNEIRMNANVYLEFPMEGW